MKKKNLNSLRLNKTSISDLHASKFKGGDDRGTIFGTACGGNHTDDHLDNTCVGVSCNACHTDVGCGSITGGGIGTTGVICEFLTMQ
ncbi:hypothetical protein [Kordia sp.]|uniref:hypothetical protein n=1 Tax=Kordia sp. TaxID=1965332 RepID=UPI003D2AF2CF